jgi:hypothetical protein
MAEQRLLVELSTDEGDDTVSISLTFDPELAGEESEERLAMGERDIVLQNIISQIAGFVLERLKDV